MNDHHLNNITKLKKHKKTKRRNIVPNPFKYVWEFSFLPTYTYPHGKHWKKVSMYLDTYPIKKGVNLPFEIKFWEPYLPLPLTWSDFLGNVYIDHLPS